MKITTIAAIALLAASGSVFAQSTPGSNADQSAGTQAAPSSSLTVAQADYGQPVPGKTRAQVYHSLVQAEQDGQMAYLNKTLYAHSH